MRFSTSIVFFIIFCGISGQLFAQESFDRLHQLGQNISMLSQDIIQLENENYIMFSTVDTLDVENLNLTSANLSMFDPKGNFVSSVDYYFRDTISLESDGQIELTQDGYLVSAISDADTMFNIIVMSLDVGRNPIWTKTYGSGLEIAQEANHQAEIVNVSDSIYVVLATIQGEENQELGMISLNPENGDILAFSSLEPNITDGLVNALDHSMTISSDTTRVIVGGNLNDGASMYLFEADAISGNIVWSRSYTPEGVADGISLADIIVAQDSSILITGTVDDKALVARFDSLGAYIWGFELAEPINTDGLSIDILESGFIRIAGGQVTGEANIYTPFQITLTPDGSPMSQAQFPLFSGSYLVDAKMEGTLDEGSLFLGTGVEIDSAIISDAVPSQLRPRLIKTDAMNLSTCEEELVIRLDSSLFVMDTLIWQMTDISDGGDTIETTVAGTQLITTPVLSLRDTTFCPGDPIEFLIDATTEGAVSYLWYDAEDGPAQPLGMDSTFLGTELDVQYVAVVTVVDEFCYVMCDTTTLTDLDPPTVQLAVLNDNFCTDGTFDIFAQIGGASIIDVEWSTGERNVASISVTEFGDYSITVTNICEETGMATATTQVTENDLPAALVPSFRRSNPCDSPGQLDLILSNASDFMNIQWSTGDTGASTTVTEPGTYTLDALDLCGLAVTGTVVVADDELFSDPLEFSVDIGVCDEDNDMVELILNINQGTPTLIEWFSVADGTTQSIATDVQTLTLSSMGTYFVELTDICETVVSPDITDPCQCLQFPNAFLPSSQASRDFGPNDTFGPVNNCSEVLSYNLKIFNRWGQKVFESDAIADEWTGKEGNDIDRAGVYVWVANYETSNGEFSLKGDVTLLQ